MSVPSAFSATLEDYRALLRRVSSAVNLSARMPRWPFNLGVSSAAVIEFDVLMGERVVPVVQSLMTEAGDESVLVAGVEPIVDYVAGFFDVLPGFEMQADAVSRYADLLMYAPAGDVTAAMGITMNTLVIAGSRGQWAIVGERDWEVALVASATDALDGLRSSLPLFGVDVDLRSIRSPEGWGVPLTERALAAFRANALDALGGRASSGEQP